MREEAPMFPRKTIVLGALALLVVLALGTGTFILAEEEAASVCEKAVFSCLTDPYIRAGGWQLFFYCLEGYVFCKKYVEPLIR
jgi:hypothetical protein